MMFAFLKPASFLNSAFRKINAHQKETILATPPREARLEMYRSSTSAKFSESKMPLRTKPILLELAPPSHPVAATLPRVLAALMQKKMLLSKSCAFWKVWAVKRSPDKSKAKKMSALVIHWKLAKMVESRSKEALAKVRRLAKTVSC
jgi:hypothetical protein